MVKDRFQDLRLSRANQLDLRFPHVRSASLGISCFGERAAISHRLVCRILGHTNAGGIRHPDSRKPFEQPPRPASAARGVRDSRNCDRAAVYVPGRFAWVYAAPCVVVGRHRFPGLDLSSAGAGREVLVLSTARFAVTVGALSYLVASSAGVLAGCLAIVFSCACNDIWCACWECSRACLEFMPSQVILFSMLLPRGLGTEVVILMRAH